MAMNVKKSDTAAVLNTFRENMKVQSELQKKGESRREEGGHSNMYVRGTAASIRGAWKSAEQLGASPKDLEKIVQEFEFSAFEIRDPKNRSAKQIAIDAGTQGTGALPPLR